LVTINKYELFLTAIAVVLNIKEKTTSKYQ